MPKLPAALSEGIAEMMLPKLFDVRLIVDPPGNTDLAFMNERDGIHLIAVKGTGPSRWITVTLTDLQADDLVWVDYSHRITGRNQPTKLWVFSVGSWMRPGPRTLQQFLLATPAPVRCETFGFALAALYDEQFIVRAETRAGR